MCKSKNERVCGSLLADDDVFSRHSAMWNMLLCLLSDEIQCACLSSKIQQTMHFLNQQSHTLPAETSKAQMLAATSYEWKLFK